MTKSLTSNRHHKKRNFEKSWMAAWHFFIRLTIIPVWQTVFVFKGTLHQKLSLEIYHLGYSGCCHTMTLSGRAFPQFLNRRRPSPLTSVLRSSSPELRRRNKNDPFYHQKKKEKHLFKLSLAYVPDLACLGIYMFWITHQYAETFSVFFIGYPDMM